MKANLPSIMNGDRLCLSSHKSLVGTMQNGGNHVTCTVGTNSASSAYVSKNVSTKRTRKSSKATTKSNGVPKPKRPLTAYNFFFRHERARLVGEDPSPVSTLYVDGQTQTQRRRQHRKTHGKIGFLELARHIGDSWNDLDVASRSIFEAQAQEDLNRYRREMEVYKSKTEAVIATRGGDEMKQGTKLRKFDVHQTNEKLYNILRRESIVGKNSKAGGLVADKINTTFCARTALIETLQICDVKEDSHELQEPSLSGGSITDLENDLRHILGDDVINSLAQLNSCSVERVEDKRNVGLPRREVRKTVSPPSFDNPIWGKNALYPTSTTKSKDFFKMNTNADGSDKLNIFGRNMFGMEF